MLGMTFGELVFLGKQAAITTLIALGFVQPIIADVWWRMPLVMAALTYEC